LERGLGALLASISTGEDQALLQQIGVIEASIARTFQALPKNDLGRLPPAGVRHAVRTYFARQHGWQIRGLEPIGAQVDVRHVQNVTILQERAPALL